MIGHKKMSSGGAFMPFNENHRKYAKSQTEAMNQTTRDKQASSSQSEALVPISREVVTINSKKDDLERATRNIVYVRDLSAKATENQLRAVFSEFDAILKVAFFRFNNPDGLPNLSAPPFAEITYASDKGVTEASKMTGLLVAGTPCTVTVVHPNHDIATKSDEKVPERLQTLVTYTPCKELNRSDVDLQVAKTVHISGLASWMTEVTVKEVMEQCFGNVVEARVDKTQDGKPFALAEFAVMQSAMLALRQKQVAMEYGEDENVTWTLTPSKSLVHEQKVVEKAVSFAHTTIMVNAYGGLDYAAVANALELNDKLAQVQQTAFELGIQSATHPDGRPKTEREKLTERIAMMEAKIARKKVEEEEEKEEKEKKRRKKEQKRREKRARKEERAKDKKKKRSRSSSSSQSSSSSSKKKDKKRRKSDNCEMLQ